MVGKKLQLNFDNIDNDFGVISGYKGLEINANKELMNQNGYIFSNENITMTGDTLKNGLK